MNKYNRLSIQDEKRLFLRNERSFENSYEGVEHIYIRNFLSSTLTPSCYDYIDFRYDSEKIGENTSNDVLNSLRHTSET